MFSNVFAVDFLHHVCSHCSRITCYTVRSVNCLSVTGVCPAICLVHRGDRVAQLILERITMPPVQEVLVSVHGGRQKVLFVVMETVNVVIEMMKHLL